MIKVFDRIKEISTTDGTGNFKLEGALFGFRPFSSVYASGDYCYYTIVLDNNYEIGSGEYIFDGSNHWLSRFPIHSTNSNNLVNFSNGVKEVFVTYPAKYAVYSEKTMNSGNLAFWGAPNSLDSTNSLSWNGSSLQLNGVNVSVSGHTHTSNDILDFNQTVSGLLPITNIVGGPNISVTTSGTTYTIGVSGQLGLTAEQVDDRVASLLVAGTGIVLNYNDNSDILTINTSVLQPSGNYSVVGHTHSSSDITDFNSAVSNLLPRVANSGDNRVLTSDGSTSGIVAESNLTFNGTKLSVTGDITVDNLTLDLNTIVSSSGNLVIAPAVSGALVASITGNARGANAVDLQTARSQFGGNAQVSSGASSVIGGGSCNIASGGCSVVAGGTENRAIETYSTVSGGFGNRADGFMSTVSGGYGHCAAGVWSTVGGGYGHRTCSFGSTVGGGLGNISNAAFGTVSGGCNNTATEHATISGGISNTASGYRSTVSGGYCNTASARCSSVGGGACNITNARHSRIGGGHRNIIQSPTNECCSRGATIGGGVGHNTSGGTLDANTGDLTGAISCCNAGAFSTIGGGLRNCATGACSTVSGGYGNTAKELRSTVGGGLNNTAYDAHSTVAGGCANTASGSSSTVGGGALNSACGNFSTVVGGLANTSSGYHATVIGGVYGKATRYGETSHAAGRFAANGDAQHTILIARRNTTDATPNVLLFLDGNSARLTIPASTAWTFSIKLSAYNNTNNQAAWWIFRGGIRRNAADKTALVGSLIVENDSESTLSTASATVVADDTNQALEIRVTGVAAKDIRWVAVADISQVSWGTP